jgi:hypothetical protein
LSCGFAREVNAEVKGVRRSDNIERPEIQRFAGCEGVLDVTTRIE